LRLFLGLCILFFSFQSQALIARVLIDEESPSQTLQGEFRIQCLKGRCSKKTYRLGVGSWQLKRSPHGLHVFNEKSKKKGLMKGRFFRIQGSFKIENTMIQRLDIFLLSKATHWVVHVPVDQYLYGVMSSEVPVSWPLETLKAQAVASRTYFLYKKKERIDQHFDVRASIMDQVFKMNADKHQSILQAVNETHDMILTSKEQDQVFPAYFHSDCGGQTSSEQAVWRKPSALNQSVQDPYCQTASKNNWTFAIDRDHLMQHLRHIFYIPKGADLQSVLPRLHEKSRAHVVDFLFSDRIVKRISANELRKQLGFGKLRSTHFHVQQGDRDIVFSGRGFGHGVGLCQWGGPALGSYG
jgi:stage II sporulation protein D